jgi:hypothetical protein
MFGLVWASAGKKRGVFLGDYLTEKEALREQERHEDNHDEIAAPREVCDLC